ncbi:MAG: tRNA (N6-threonylcarbamoyladenosine(37)-N6)-methyltransferase TrmO [Candidatus Cloacimonetes bacterium]|nr:tRNA (N6-threonylcarbamoyladenosine(37)-N6)-methyltransferase TrmO [Candidatus Cloacimonadota bacterium]
MEKSLISFSSIGVIHTPHNSLEQIPIQSSGATKIIAEIEVFPQYREGLMHLEGFSHIFLLYHFHKVTTTKLLVKPFLDDSLHGVFATRAPVRPNPIGISVVELLEVTDSGLIVRGADMLNNTPLLDIKPFIDGVDNPPVQRSGWLTGKLNYFREKVSDNRFTQD